MVARKLATKFGESERERGGGGEGGGNRGGGARGSGGEAQRESILCESRSARPPAAFSFLFPPLLFSFYPLLPRAILSSRICDHQHAKWIKFLDYTFRSPFLYSLPIPIPGRPSRPRTSSPSRIAQTVSQIVSPHLRISVPRACSILHPCFRPLFLLTFFVSLFFFR